MNLKEKILTGYLVVFSLLVIVVICALVFIINLGRASDAILRENYRSISAAENMMKSIAQQDNILLMILQQEQASELIDELRTEEDTFIEWLVKSNDNITIEGEDQLVSRIKTDFFDYRKNLLEFLMIDNFNAAGKSYYQNNLKGYINDINSRCTELKNLNEHRMYNASNQAKSLSRKALITTLSLASISLFASLVISFYLSDKIVSPLKSFSEASRLLSEGNYSVKVDVDTKDELGILASDFNRMAEKLGTFHAMNIEQLVVEKNKAGAILSSIEDGLVVFDHEGKISGLNPAAGKILNIGIRHTLPISCDEVLPNSVICSLVRKTLIEGHQQELPEEERMVVLPGSDGVQKHYLFTITKIQKADKPVTGIILMLRDITRMKELENLKSEFVMAASHELRTPLTSLCVSIDLIKEKAAGKVPDDELELIETAKEEIFHMKSLTEDLLELSRLESGRIDIDFEKVSSRHLLEYIDSIFKKQMELQNVKLSLDTKDEDIIFIGDENKISWVLSNLISNALRYVGNNGKIRISTVKIGYNVHFSVEDNGLGIPEEYQTRIFQKFSRIKGRKSGGSGLGLAICKEIVRAHGGTIWVESKPGKGSIFTFTLPAIT